MEKDFWLERWERAEIGFHQDEVNPYLQRYWSILNPAPGSKIFVPLCGKSRDMIWLRNQGHPVVGVEFSPIAVESFFAENGYVPSTTKTERFQQYEADGIRILCGDYFDLTANDLQDVTAVFDRASLVALPPEMRPRYAHHLLDILPPQVHILLVAFDYEQKAMPGPPFAISFEEIQTLYSARAAIELLAQIDVLEDNPRFKTRGLNRLHEHIYLLSRT